VGASFCLILVGPPCKPGEYRYTILKLCIVSPLCVVWLCLILVTVTFMGWKFVFWGMYIRVTIYNSSWVMSSSSNVLFVFAVMCKNIFTSNTCTQNTTSRDLCVWMAVCDWPCLKIRINWAVTTLWCNKSLKFLPVYWTGSQVIEKCLLYPNSTNNCRDCFCQQNVFYEVVIGHHSLEVSATECCTCKKQGFGNSMYDINGFILQNLIFIWSS